MSDIHLLDHNPIDSRLTFIYKRRLHMAKRQNDGLRLTQYVSASKRWVPIPVVSPAGQALHDHLIEHSIQVGHHRDLKRPDFQSGHSRTTKDGRAPP